MFKGRSASDIVIVVITGTIALTLLISAVSILILEIINSDNDTNSLIEVETEILAVLTGAVVGFLGGRSVGRNEAIEEESS